MRKKIFAMVLAVTLGLSMAVGVSAEVGGDGTNWETDTFGANIAFGTEDNSATRPYKLNEFFEFYTDTYCSGAKNIPGTRTLEVKAYEKSDPAGIGSVEYKDGEVWKNISEYNTRIFFINDVNRVFHVQFVKNGIYTICSYFIADNESVRVRSKMRYIIVDHDTLTITKEAPEPKQYMEETTTETTEKTTSVNGQETTTGTAGEMSTGKGEPSKGLGVVQVKNAYKKKSAKKVKITLNASLKNANGYIVCFYKSKKAANKNKKPFVKRIYKKNKVSFTISNKYLKKQKKLFVRVRGYMVENKKMVYCSNWSVTKKVTIKK